MTENKKFQVARKALEDRAGGEITAREIVGNHEFVSYTKDDGYPCVIEWIGRRTKPANWTRFQTEARRTDFINGRKQEALRNEGYKSRAADAVKELVAGLVVGDILYTTWGYDQTNVTWYQVIEIKPKTLVVREVASKRVDDGGFMTHTETPVKDAFVGPEEVRRIGEQGINIMGNTYGGRARKFEGTPVHTSSYA